MAKSSKESWIAKRIQILSAKGATPEAALRVATAEWEVKHAKTRQPSLLASLRKQSQADEETDEPLPENDDVPALDEVPPEVAEAAPDTMFADSEHVFVVQPQRSRRKASKTVEGEIVDQPDFFELVFQNFSMKSDMEGMEIPIFSLSTQTDFEVWRWSSKDGKTAVIVAPSADVGRATIHDKDILIYCISQLVEGLKRGEAIKKTVRFVYSDFAKATERGTTKAETTGAIRALMRLKGTNITILKDGEVRGKGFGLIDDWEVIERETAGGKKRMTAVQVVLSDRLLKSVVEHQVLTINKDYFKLRKPAKRRLYEIARKHCGAQASWDIGLAELQRKMGSTDKRLTNFRAAVIESTIEDDDLPDYRVSIKDQTVTFRQKDQKKLAEASLKKLGKPS